MSCLAEDILNRINSQEQIKIVSLDIFDTLLFRTVKTPSDVFEMVGYEAVKKGFLLKHIYPIEYKNIRKRIEKKARDNKKLTCKTSEVSLEEIYSYLPEGLGNKEKLLELEIAMEKEVCYLNPTMQEVIKKSKAAGKRIILISDMYLSKQQITEILSYNGLDIKDIYEIYISCEHALTKRDGKLYTQVLEQLKAAPQEIFHIGDNYISDIVNAKDINMETFYYNVVSSDDNIQLQMEALKYGNLAPQIYSLRKYAAALGENLQEEHRKWFCIGAMIMGPLLSGMAEWVLDLAETNQIHSIYPLMREGKLIAKLLEGARENRKYDCKIAPMYISRKAVFLPSLIKYEEEALRQVLFIKKANVSNLFEMLQIENYKMSFMDLMDMPLTELREKMKEEGGREKQLYDYLLSDEVKNIVNQRIDESSEAALGYLKELGIKEEPFLTVDIGYRGTMQRGLEKLLGKEDSKSKHNIHALLFGQYDCLDKVLEDVDIRGYAGSYGANEDLILEVTHRPYILEQLMMCDEGTTLGYKKQLDKFIPIQKKVSCLDQEQLQYIEWAQDGMLQFQKHYLELKPKKKQVEGLKENTAELVKIVLRLVTMPTLDEAHCLGELKYDDNYGADIIQKLCNEESLNIIKNKGIDYYLQTTPPGKAAWQEGLIVQADPAYYINKIISNSASQYEKSIIDVVKQVVANGTKSVVIIGAGEAGRMMQKYLNIYGIQIEAFIDNNIKLQGHGINGIPVLSMEGPFEASNFVIGSFAFTAELTKQAKSTIGEHINLHYYGKEVSDGTK